MTTKLKVYQIETTNACNLKCSFCPIFADWYKRPPGFMDPDLIDRVDWSATKYTEVQFSGEPLLHKKLGEVLERIKAKGVRVGFSTNGTFKDRLEAVLPIADSVTVNDDDFRDPVFEEKPNVFVQRLGDNSPFEDYTRTKPGVVPQCDTPFGYVSIHWNGDVVPCCKDHSGVHVFGNLFEQTFEQIEHGEVRREFLAGLAAGQANKLCEFCEQPNPHLGIHDRLIQIGRKSKWAK